MENCDIFLIFAQNIDCGYTLEPPYLCFRANIRKLELFFYKKTDVSPIKESKKNQKITYEGCPESFETVPISYKVFIS